MSILTTNKDFLTAVRERRSLYAISKESTIQDSKIEEIITEAVKYTPSAFNSQTTRIVLLLGEHHNRLWDLTTEVLRAIVPANEFEPTQQKMNGFRGGYGTILFFEDLEIVEFLQKQFPTYQDKFPEWAQHTNAMHQFVIWTALEAEGLGANLQHYNPLIDEKVKSEWHLPESWKLIAQMPFGKPTASAPEKEMNPVDERFKIFK